MTLIWPTRLGPGLRRFCRPRGRAGDLALPTFVPSSTPSFTFCGQAANGDYCHANFHLGARSTITFRPGKMPVCGFIYTACSTSRPVAMRVERPGPSVVIVDGQSVKTTERGGTRGFDAYKRVKGPQTSHPSRHPWTTARQPCRTGRHIRSARVCSAAWRTACVVSEDPDGHSRCWPPKP
jgi:hypothetical protein